jgi:hypothetical protein
MIDYNYNHNLDHHMLQRKQNETMKITIRFIPEHSVPSSES